MLIDHVHFYVENAAATCSFFKKMGFQAVETIVDEHTHTEILHCNNSIFLLISSAINLKSPVCHHLNYFASGVSNIAFQVENIDSIIHKLIPLQDYIIDEPYTYFLSEGKIKVAKVKGFGYLEHTLVENHTKIPFVYLLSQLQSEIDQNVYKIKQTNQLKLKLFSSNNNAYFDSIDHVVLNVNQGKLAEAVEFYRKIFDFKIWQKFKIKTHTSGLFSQALLAPNNGFYLNINEPTSNNSQIQDFIDLNGGAGIQHIALHTPNIINTVTELNSRGMDFLPVTNNYYKQQKKYGRNGIIPHLTSAEWDEIENQNILVDCYQENSESLLMQIFTKPIFNEPTFFFELIERRNQAQGFGEGNFQTLFELIEKQQITKNK